MNASAYQAALLLAPYFPCWFSLSKQPSVTVEHDGGKVLCGIKEIAQRKRELPCTVVSIGSNFNRKFEDEMDTSTGRGRCDIHIFDPTMNSTERQQTRLQRWLAELPPNYHFHAVGAVGRKRHFHAFQHEATLTELLRMATPSAGLDVLKFDIDGYEGELLDDAHWSQIKAGLLVFELHSKQISEVRGQQYTLPTVLRHLALLEAAGYRLYSVEPVYAHRWCPPPRCDDGVGQAELAFIHKDWNPREGSWDGGGCVL